MWAAALLALAPADPAAVDRIVADALRDWGVPGAAVVVVRAGEIVHLKGYGVRRVGDPAAVTPDTVFPLASCTKGFTAAAVAALVGDGTLSWDDPVRKHLPTFRLTDPHADGLVTLRDLLTHRTGVAGHDLLWYHAPWDLSETLLRAAKLPVEKPFRGAFQYSSIMVTAAGRAAANRAGVPWAELVRDRVTGPLGMTAVYFTSTDPAYRASERPTGHREVAGRPEPMPVYEVKEPNPAGSMFLTPRAAAAWLRLHLGKGEFAGKRVVPAAALAETTTPQTIMPIDAGSRRMNPFTLYSSYGMGWVVSDYRGKRMHAHGGMIDGFRVQFTLFPDDDLGIAVFNNLHETGMNSPLTNAIADLYMNLPDVNWPAIGRAARTADAADAAAAEAARRAARTNTPPAAAAAAYAGTYADAAYGEAKLEVDAGKLFWKWSSFRLELVHWDGDVYRVKGGVLGGRTVEFRVAAGKPTAARFMTRVFDRTE